MAPKTMSPLLYPGKSSFIVDRGSSFGVCPSGSPRVQRRPRSTAGPSCCCRRSSCSPSRAPSCSTAAMAMAVAVAGASRGAWATVGGETVGTEQGTLMLSCFRWNEHLLGRVINEARRHQTSGPPACAISARSVGRRWGGGMSWGGGGGGFGSGLSWTRGGPAEEHGKHLPGQRRAGRAAR